jgi:hypothetical protein
LFIAQSLSISHIIYFVLPFLFLNTIFYLKKLIFLEDGSYLEEHSSSAAGGQQKFGLQSADEELEPDGVPEQKLA